jgi:hypothetical protein
VGYQTGRTDILELVNLGFLEVVHTRPRQFMPVRDLPQKINAIK